MTIRNVHLKVEVEFPQVDGHTAPQEESVPMARTRPPYAPAYREQIIAPAP